MSFDETGLGLVWRSHFTFEFPVVLILLYSIRFKYYGEVVLLSDCTATYGYQEVECLPVTINHFLESLNFCRFKYATNM